MLLLQAALCFSANGLMALLAVLFLRDAGRLVAARLGAALFLASIGYSLTLLPSPLRLPGPLYVGAALANVPTLGLSLLFCRALLVDGFCMGAREWALLAGLSGLMLLASRPLLGLPAPGQNLAEAALGIAGLCVLAHLFWVAMTGYRGDLVDARRRVRVGVVVFGLLNAVAVGVIELRGMSVTAEGIAFDSGTLVLCLAILLWITRTEPERFFAVPPPVPTPAPRASRGHSPPHMATKTRLLAAMKEEAWREEGLTIGGLAGRVRVPEHQLRALINKEMGYRNFAEFLNGYRLDAAKAALSNPKQVDTPILTIAMDVGYRTLSTFNRAFKAREGETPSAFRDRALSG